MNQRIRKVAIPAHKWCAPLYVLNPNFQLGKCFLNPRGFASLVSKNFGLNALDERITTNVKKGKTQRYRYYCSTVHVSQEQDTHLGTDKKIHFTVSASREPYRPVQSMCCAYYIVVERQYACRLPFCLAA